MHTFRQLLRTLFQGLYQTIMIFSESYWQTVLPTFQIFYHYQTTLTFSELLANNTTHFPRVYINQYWHFERVPSKLTNSKNFSQSSYHTILVLSESYYQTILTCSELKSNSIYTFVQLLSNNSKHFFENLNGHLNGKKILKQNIPKQKREKLA